MSEELENNEIENMDGEAVTVDEETVEDVDGAREDAVEEDTDNGEEEAAVEPVELDDQLFDKVQRAARLLRNRKFAMGREAEEDAERNNDLLRALKLLELKPQMEQKEMSDLMGMRLRELDVLLHQAEEAGIVTRVKPEEEDMRAILVSATENAVELAEAQGSKRKKLIPQLSLVDAEDIVALMDKLIEPLTEMGLDNSDDRGSRDRHDGRAPRSGFGGRGRDDRGGDRGRSGFGDRGGRGGHDDRGPRKDFGGRGDRGGRSGFGDRDRGGRDFGGGRFGDRDRGGRNFGGDRGGRSGFGDRDRGGRGGFGGRDDRGSRGGYGDRNRGGYGDRGSRGGYGDRGGRGGYGDRGGYRN